MNLVRAELLKVQTTRLLVWLGLLLTLMSIAFLSLEIGQASEANLRRLSEQRSILEHAGIGSLFALIAGIVAAAGEWAHGTIAQTFLIAPSRSRVAVAKAAASMLVGLALGLVAVLTTVAVTSIWYAARNPDLQLGNGSVLRPLGGSLLAAAIAGPIGVGVALVLRRQTGAIVFTLLWLLIGEGALNVAGNVARFAPGHAMAAVVSGGGGDLLHFWPGLAVASAYALFLVAAGIVVVERTDVS